MNVHLSRLGERITETISEHTRYFSDVASPSSIITTLTPVEEKNLKKHLDGTNDRDRLLALKRLITLMSKNRDVSPYFPSVVKNVASPHLEIRKLVYLYLLRYAALEPDLVLLTINTFQRDLGGDPNPVIRGMAVRVLSSMKVAMVSGVVGLAVKKGASDPSAYVRANAAMAMERLVKLDPGQLDVVKSTLEDLLMKRRTDGAVWWAWEKVAAKGVDMGMLHRVFRRACAELGETDEWGQIQVVRVLLRYARVMFARPGGIDEEHQQHNPDLVLLLDAVQPLLASRNPSVVLAASSILFYLSPTPKTHWPLFVSRLVRLLHTSPQVERCLLPCLLLISSDSYGKTLLTPYLSHFFLRTSDSPSVKKSKIALLLSLISPSSSTQTVQAVLRELVDASWDTEDAVVECAVGAIGGVVERVVGAQSQGEDSADTGSVVNQAIAALVGMLQRREDIAVGTAVIVLKSLVRYLPDPLSTIRTLAQRLFPALQPSRYPHTSASTSAKTGIRHPQGRACILWLVGQYAPREEWTPDVLRLAIKYFFKEGSEPEEKEKDEDARVKLQVVTLGAKVWVEWCHPSSSSEDAKSTRLDKLVGYLFTLARYDRSFDVRDRARMLAGLLGLGTHGQELSEKGGVVLRKEQVRVVLFEGRGPNPTGAVKDVDENDRESSSSVGSSAGILGSTSLVLGRPDLFAKERESESDEWFGGVVLSEWLARGVDGSLRDSEWEKAPVSGSSGIGIRTGNEKSAFGFGSGSGSGFGVRIGGFQSGSGSQSQSQSPVVLTPVSSSLTTAMDVVKSKYEDLDAFYAEEEQEEGVDDDEEEEEGTEEEGDENDEEEEGESGEGESRSESGEEQDDDEGERERGQVVPSPRGG